MRNQRKKTTRTHREQDLPHRGEVQDRWRRELRTDQGAGGGDPAAAKISANAANVQRDHAGEEGDTGVSIVSEEAAVTSAVGSAEPNAGEAGGTASLDSFMDRLK